MKIYLIFGQRFAWFKLSKYKGHKSEKKVHQLQLFTNKFTQPSFTQTLKLFDFLENFYIRVNRYFHKVTLIYVIFKEQILKIPVK